MPSFTALKNTVITLELLRKIIFLPHYFFAVGGGGGGGAPVGGSDVQKCHFWHTNVLSWKQ